MSWLHKDYELCPTCQCMRDTRAGHLCPGPAPEDVDAARERVHERIERLDDPFLGASDEDDDEF